MRLWARAWFWLCDFGGGVGTRGSTASGTGPKVRDFAWVGQTVGLLFWVGQALIGGGKSWAIRILSDFWEYINTFVLIIYLTLIILLKLFMVSTSAHDQQL